MRKAAAAVAGLLVFSAAAGLAETPAGLENFPVRYGDRESRKIAITMDDANEREYVWKAAELCEQYGITMTFFPVRASSTWLLNAGVVTMPKCPIATFRLGHSSMTSFISAI